MNELTQALTGDSAAAPPAHILEGVSSDLAHEALPFAPHTIYEELWHIAFWQQVTLDWVRGIETPFPVEPAAGFPKKADANVEHWDQLRQRFLDSLQQVAVVSENEAGHNNKVRCPSRPGNPVRIMTVREQLESLAAHNAYHLGRIVLLRQLRQAWPPPSGGFTW